MGVQGSGPIGPQERQGVPPRDSIQLESGALQDGTGGRFWKTAPEEVLCRLSSNYLATCTWPETSLASLGPFVRTSTAQNGRYGPDRRILLLRVAQGS